MGLTALIMCPWYSPGSSDVGELEAPRLELAQKEEFEVSAFEGQRYRGWARSPYIT
jgi:hypothetical protein